MPQAPPTLLSVSEQLLLKTDAQCLLGDLIERVALCLGLCLKLRQGTWRLLLIPAEGSLTLTQLSREHM